MKFSAIIIKDFEQSTLSPTLTTICTSLPSTSPKNYARSQGQKRCTRQKVRVSSDADMEATCLIAVLPSTALLIDLR